MYATNYLETLVLNTLRGQSAAAPAGLYAALYLSNPGETGTEGTEVSYQGYQRKAVTFTTPAALNGGIGFQNAEEITFPITPVSLGAITHIGILDSASGGNMLLYGEFTESVTVEANESPVIVAGEAQWWITGAMSSAYKTKALNLLRSQNIPGFTPHVALYNGNPEDGGAELSGDNYARVPVAFSAPAQQVGGQTQIVNSGQVNTVRASSAWGTLTYAAIMDAQTAGQPVYYLARTPKEFRRGLMLMYDPGTLKVSIN